MLVWVVLPPAAESGASKLQMALANIHVKVRVDELAEQPGTLNDGFSHVLELEPGVHTVVARAGLRRRELSFTVPDAHEEGEALRVELSYNRTWGGFHDRISVRTVPVDEVGVHTAPDALTGAPADALSAPPSAPPYATFTLIALMVLVFALEYALPVAPREGLSPSIPTLAGFGGLDVQSMRNGEFARLLTCTFLHANLPHLLLNMLALLMVGVGVEGRLGWRWFLTLYSFGALGGSGVSLWLNDGHTLSVGASGAIMGLFAGGLFVAQTMPESVRRPFQFQLLRVLVPSLLPLGTRGGGGVDIGAHLGGALVGGLAGLLAWRALQRAKHSEEDVRRFRRSPAATLIAGLFAAASLASAGWVATVGLPEARAEQIIDESLLPNEQLTEVNLQNAASRVGWLRDYPNDPRVILLAYDDAFNDGDAETAGQLLDRLRELLPRYRGRFAEEYYAQMEETVQTQPARVALIGRLVPANAWPTGTPDEIAQIWRDNLQRWLQRYPDDPRVRERAAVLALDAYQQSKDAADAERAEAHARHGLAHLEEFRLLLPDTDRVRGWLMLALYGSLFVRPEASVEMAAVKRELCEGSSDAGRYARERGLCAAAPNE